MRWHNQRGVVFFLVLVLALMLPIASVIAQEQLRFPNGDLSGVKFVSKATAPYFVVLPSSSDRGVAETIGKKILHLDANAYVIDDQRMRDLLSTAIKPDTLLSLLEPHLKLLREITDAPLILFAEQQMASVALLESLRNFRVRAVVAVSPGEYFWDREGVKSRINGNRVPLLVMHTSEETEFVKKLFSDYPPSLLIGAPVLERSGFHDLAENTKTSGAAWLAVNIFYKEHFNHTAKRK